MPTRIAKYDIVRRLGFGGMGTVYLGRDRDLDRHVAIKVLREPMADEELLQRFLREARAAANLRHENLITVYEIGDHDHQPFIAMEYVDGASLAELIRRREALPLAQKLSCIEQICDGLHHAHRAGIVHRDIKPANLMVDANGVIRILDFGIARVANSGMTSDGALIGTLNYMSPEQMLGKPVDFRSDIFSVGAVAYELLSYQQAFPGGLDDGLLQRLPQIAPTPLAEVCPGLPPGLEAIVTRALNKAPLERYGDLDEMRGAIRHLRAGIDPHLQLETIVIPSRDKPKASVHPASPAERRELLERRARQIAIHRDAARAALMRGDLDSAAAACDDALTLDPDDVESTHILAEIQQAKEQRDQESKARRERERAVRQRVADAELTLSRGDVAAAARLLEQVFHDEAREPAALALLEKVREAAGAAGIPLPETLNRAVSLARSEPPSEPTRLAHRPQPDSQRSRLSLYAAAALVVIAVAAGVAWVLSGNRSAPAPQSAAAAPVSVPVDSPAATSASSPPIPQSSPVAPPPAPTTTPAAPTLTPVAAPAPGPVTTAPPPAADSLAPTLARIAQLQQSGNVEGALAELARIGSSSDSRVAPLARSVAQSAFRSMDGSLAAALAQKAANLAPASYAAAEQARGLADAASSRSDFVEAGTRALAASEAYRKAAADAQAAAALAAKTADPAPIARTPAPESPPSPRAEVSAAPPNPAPATTPRPSAPDIVTPGIMRALSRYQDAYRQMSVKALQNVYPGLPRETRQQLEKQFDDCRAYDVTFLNPDVRPAASLTAATVNVRTTYACQPKSGQRERSQTVPDIFQLSKVGDEWQIDDVGIGNTNRRR